MALFNMHLNITGTNSANGVLAGFHNQLQLVQNQYTSLQQQTTKVGDAFDFLSNKVSILTNIFASFAIGKVVEGFIDTNAAVEKTVIQLTSLQGSAEKANQSLKYLYDLAQTTPFQLTSLQAAFVRLQSAGVDPMDKSLKILTDTLAAFGGTSSDLQLVTLAIQQMASKGVISMEELRQQLAERIPTAAMAMAEGLGMSMNRFYAEVAKGNIVASEGIDAMLSTFEKWYGGMGAQMMTSWIGLIQLLKTNLQLLFLAIGETGVFDTLKGKLIEVVNWLSRLAQDKSLTEFGISVKGVLNSVITIIEAVIDSLKAFWKGFASSGVLESFKALLSQIASTMSGELVGASQIVGSAVGGVLKLFVDLMRQLVSLGQVISSIVGSFSGLGGSLLYIGAAIFTAGAVMNSIIAIGRGAAASFSLLSSAAVASGVSLASTVAPASAASGAISSTGLASTAAATRLSNFQAGILSVNYAARLIGGIMVTAAESVRTLVLATDMYITSITQGVTVSTAYSTALNYFKTTMGAVVSNQTMLTTAITSASNAYLSVSGTVAGAVLRYVSWVGAILLVNDVLKAGVAIFDQGNSKLNEQTGQVERTRTSWFSFGSSLGLVHSTLGYLWNTFNQGVFSLFSIGASLLGVNDAFKDQIDYAKENKNAFGDLISHYLLGTPIITNLGGSQQTAAEKGKELHKEFSEGKLKFDDYIDKLRTTVYGMNGLKDAGNLTIPTIVNLKNTYDDLSNQLEKLGRDFSDGKIGVAEYEEKSAELKEKMASVGLSFRELTNKMQESDVEYTKLSNSLQTSGLRFAEVKERMIDLVKAKRDDIITQNEANGVINSTQAINQRLGAGYEVVNEKLKLYTSNSEALTQQIIKQEAEVLRLEMATGKNSVAYEQATNKLRDLQSALQTSKERVTDLSEQKLKFQTVIDGTSGALALNVQEQKKLENQIIANSSAMDKYKYLSEQGIITNRQAADATFKLNEANQKLKEKLDTVTASTEKLTEKNEENIKKRQEANIEVLETEKRLREEEKALRESGTQNTELQNKVNELKTSLREKKIALKEVEVALNGVNGATKDAIISEKEYQLLLEKNPKLFASAMKSNLEVLKETHKTQMMQAQEIFDNSKKEEADIKRLTELKKQIQNELFEKSKEIILKEIEALDKAAKEKNKMDSQYYLDRQKLTNDLLKLEQNYTQDTLKAQKDLKSELKNLEDRKAKEEADRLKEAKQREQDYRDEQFRAFQEDIKNKREKLVEEFKKASQDRSDDNQDKLRGDKLTSDQRDSIQKDARERQQAAEREHNAKLKELDKALVDAAKANAEDKKRINDSTAANIEEVSKRVRENVLENYQKMTQGAQSHGTETTKVYKRIGEDGSTIYTNLSDAARNSTDSATRAVNAQGTTVGTVFQRMNADGTSTWTNIGTAATNSTNSATVGVNSVTDAATRAATAVTSIGTSTTSASTAANSAIQTITTALGKIDNKTVTITFKPTGLDEIKDKYDKLTDKTITITFKPTGLDEIKDKYDKLIEKTITLNFKPTGLDEIKDKYDKLIEKTITLNFKLTGLNEIKEKYDNLKDKEIKLLFIGIEEISKIQSAYDYIKDKKITITTAGLESIQAIEKVYNSLINKSITITVNGLSSVQSIFDVYSKIVDKQITISCDYSQVTAAIQAINSIPTEKHVYVYVHTVQLSALGGIAGDRMYGGGKLSGYGGGDTVPALLEPGEFIVRKEAVSQYGPQLFWLLNSMKLSAKDLLDFLPRQRYAEGGVVISQINSLRDSFLKIRDENDAVDPTNIDSFQLTFSSLSNLATNTYRNIDEVIAKIDSELKVLKETAAAIKSVTNNYPQTSDKFSYYKETYENINKIIEAITAVRSTSNSMLGSNSSYSMGGIIQKFASGGFATDPDIELKSLKSTTGNLKSAANMGSPVGDKFDYYADYIDKMIEAMTAVRNTLNSMSGSNSSYSMGGIIQKFASGGLATNPTNNTSTTNTNTNKSSGWSNGPGGYDFLASLAPTKEMLNDEIRDMEERRKNSKRTSSDDFLTMRRHGIIVLSDEYKTIHDSILKTHSIMQQNAEHSIATNTAVEQLAPHVNSYSRLRDTLKEIAENLQKERFYGPRAFNPIGIAYGPDGKEGWLSKTIDLIALRIGIIPQVIKSFVAVHYLQDYLERKVNQREGWSPFASGGHISGYGGGDTVPALLERGEFIIRKEAVSKYGPQLFSLLNEARGFAEGGLANKGISIVPSRVPTQTINSSAKKVEISSKFNIQSYDSNSTRRWLKDVVFPEWENHMKMKGVTL